MLVLRSIGRATLLCGLCIALGAAAPRVVAWLAVPLDARVTVAFPEEPARRTSGDELTLTLETPRVALTVTRRPLPPRMKPRTPAEIAGLLRTVALGGVRVAGGRILSTRDVAVGVSLEGMPPAAIAQEVTYAQADPTQPVGTRRLWLLGHTLYWLDCAPRRDTKRALAEQDQFLTSLQISPAPPVASVVAPPTPAARAPRRRSR